MLVYLPLALMLIDVVMGRTCTRAGTLHVNVLEPRCVRVTPGVRGRPAQSVTGAEVPRYSALLVYIPLALILIRVVMW